MIVKIATIPIPDGYYPQGQWVPRDDGMTIRSASSSNGASLIMGKLQLLGMIDLIDSTQCVQKMVCVCVCVLAGL